MPEKTYSQLSLSKLEAEKHCFYIRTCNLWILLLYEYWIIISSLSIYLLIYLFRFNIEMTIA